MPRYAFQRVLELIVQVGFRGVATDALEIAFRGRDRAIELGHFLRKPTSKREVELLDAEVRAAEKIAEFIREAQTALEAGEYRLLGERMNATAQGVHQSAWLKIPDDSLQALLDTQKNLQLACHLSAIPREVLENEIEPRLATLITEPTKTKAVLKSLSNSKIKQALTSLLYLHHKDIVRQTQDFEPWALRTSAEARPALAAGLRTLGGQIQAQLVAHRGLKAQREYEHNCSVKLWKQESAIARESFHRTADKTADVQWELGPNFLDVFERVCRQDGLWVRSIPWDPARMVGWKIMASQVKLEFGDLQIAAQELAPGTMGSSPADGPAAAAADGSYFTDYVHHVAMSKPGFTPRAVTHDLLVRLLRPAEMKVLIKSHTGESTTATDAPHLAEELLEALGWRHADVLREKPLAGCVTTNAKNTVTTLTENLSGNELRIVLESLCKDVIDVVVAQLGYDHDDVWRAIEERIPEYRPSSTTRDWNEEVGLLTAGGAAMILSVLGPLGFPAMTEDVKKFCDTLWECSICESACFGSGDLRSDPERTHWGAPQKSRKISVLRF